MPAHRPARAGVCFIVSANAEPHTVVIIVRGQMPEMKRTVVAHSDATGDSIRDSAMFRVARPFAADAGDLRRQQCCTVEIASLIASVACYVPRRIARWPEGRFPAGSPVFWLLIGVLSAWVGLPLYPRIIGFACRKILSVL